MAQAVTKDVLTPFQLLVDCEPRPEGRWLCAAQCAEKRRVVQNIPIDRSRDAREVIKDARERTQYARRGIKNTRGVIQYAREEIKDARECKACARECKAWTCKCKDRARERL